MKSILVPLITSLACMTAAANAQAVLVGGFHGENATALQSPTLSAVDVTLASSIGFGSSWYSQINTPNWGTTTLDVNAATGSTNKSIVTSNAALTFTLTVTNNGTEDLFLDKIHWAVKTDGTDAAKAATLAYVGGGDLGAGVSISADVPSGVTYHDVSLGAGGLGLSDTTLSSGETAQFTWSTGASIANIRFDNLGISGEAVTTGPDTDPPTPNPMTWANVPAADGDSSISMTATTATDPSGVEYYFTCTSGGGSDSGWQSSASYADTGLTSNTTYTYTVKARDATGLFETAASAAESATTDTIDTIKPSPNPMTFALVPEAISYDTISMTATTASDDSGVEYFFDETSGNFGGTDSGWQDSAEYTDTGLDPEVQYTYTVTARDKSTAQNATDPSAAESATTPAVPVGPVLLGGFDGSNAINAPKQSSSAVGKVSMELDTDLDPIGLNPGNFMQSSSALWGTTDLDPDAENTGTHNAVLFKNGYTVFITVTNTSSSEDVTLEKLHWISKRDLSTSATHVTISYISGSLTDALGTQIEYFLDGTGARGHDLMLSDLLVDRVLAPGETATFGFYTVNGGAGVRLDNVALSGTFSDSDYITWSSGQSWIPGAQGTSGNDDYDLDGLTNDDERIFGLDPTDAQSRSPIVTPLDATAGTFSYSRRSQSITGLNFPVWYSTDLNEWFRDFNATHTAGAPANDLELVDVEINPVLLNEPKLFLRLTAEPPLTLPAPEFINAVGSNTTVTLNFTGELYPLFATDVANYTIELDGGGSVTVTDASLSDNKQTVTLTLSTALDLASSYNVNFSNLTGLTGVALAGSGTAQFQTWDDDPAGIKVFILAGQSNMVGYGNVENGNTGAGTIGSLRYLALNDDAPEYDDYDYTSLLETPGDPVNSPWRTRSDVKVWWSNGKTGYLGGPIEKGDLGPPFYGGESVHIGPEYAFGQIVGDYYPSDDVLIIKTAWGGRSLGGDFRPPSAVANRGGEVGPFYDAIFSHARQVLDNLGTEFPEWSGRGYQIVGFAWHQGFNDRVTGEYSVEYKDNLPDLISDIRSEFGKPNLPFVIASTGMATTGGVESAPYSGYSAVEQAQLWASGVAKPANVLSSDTRPFLRDAADSPAPSGQGHHWNRNAESYFLIGKALGDDMINLLTP